MATFQLSSSSDLVTGDLSAPSGTMRGFALAKPERRPAQRIILALANDAPGDRVTTPGGNGYATGTESSGNLLSLTGSLGDGQPVTLSLKVSRTNQSVVFLQPYPDKSVSFFGGILTINAPVAGGLQWRKAAIPKATSYHLGFGLNTPLAVTALVSQWSPVADAENLEQSLSLVDRQIRVSYVAPTAGILPGELRLLDTFNLERLTPIDAVPWIGKAIPTNGRFSGTLTLAPRRRRPR